jgi:hypothetical protein
MSLTSLNSVDKAILALRPCVQPKDMYMSYEPFIFKKCNYLMYKEGIFSVESSVANITFE